MQPDCLEVYKDTLQDWLDTLFIFNGIQEDIFKHYSVLYKSGNHFKRSCIKGIEFTANQLFDVFHNYMDKYTNYTVRHFIFSWWNELRHYVPGALPTLDCPWEYFKPATDEEIKQAMKDFGAITEDWNGEMVTHTHTFDGASVLEYRSHRFIIDNEWGVAWFKSNTGKIRSFQLEWDWRYLIDEYLDLEAF